MPTFGNFSFTVPHGQPFDLFIDLTRNGQPLNLSTWQSLGATVQASASSASDTRMILSTPTQIVITDAVNGHATLHMPGDLMEAIENKKKTFYMSLYGRDANGTVWWFARGTMNVIPVGQSGVEISPPAVGGLKGWMRADQGTYQDQAASVGAIADGAPVGGWKGIGGASNRFTQETAASRPTKHLSALSGLPAVRADGTDDMLHGPNLSHFITNYQFAIFLVARAVVGGSGTVDDWPVFFADSTPGLLIGAGAAGEIGLYHYSGTSGAAQLTAPYTLGTYALIEARHDSTDAVHNGTLAVGGVPQQVMPANMARVAGFFNNNSSGDLWVNQNGVATMAAPSQRVPASGSIDLTGTGAVSVIGATPGQAYSALESVGFLGLSVNGSPEVTVAAGLTAAGGTQPSDQLKSPTYFFGNFNAGQFLAGDILEWLCYSEDPTDSQRTGIRNSLNVKYDTPGYGATVQYSGGF